MYQFMRENFRYWCVKFHVIFYGERSLSTKCYSYIRDTLTNISCDIHKEMILDESCTPFIDTGNAL